MEIKMKKLLLLSLSLLTIAEVQATTVMCGNTSYTVIMPTSNNIQKNANNTITMCNDKKHT